MPRLPHLHVLFAGLLAGLTLAAPALLAQTRPAPALALTSPAFAQGGEIPAAHTCEGADLSPPLAWSQVPPGTASLALIVDDPDAPDPAAPKGTWVHWVVYNLPPQGSLAEGAKSGIFGSTLPTGARQGRADSRRTRYNGPCPPIGRHHYHFKLYALDVVLPDLDGPDKPALLRAMQGHVLAQTELIGTYQKRGR
jgi:Raf kinase inhibitor-like YbhB/YbcL family protein